MKGLLPWFSLRPSSLVLVISDVAVAIQVQGHACRWDLIKSEACRAVLAVSLPVQLVSGFYSNAKALIHAGKVVRPIHMVPHSVQHAWNSCLLKSRKLSGCSTLDPASAFLINI